MKHQAKNRRKGWILKTHFAQKLGVSTQSVRKYINETMNLEWELKNALPDYNPRNKYWRPEEIEILNHFLT